jgi:hypothetical protein
MSMLSHAKILLFGMLMASGLVVSYHGVRGGSALLRNSAVGGVSISTEGIVSDATEEARRATRQSWEEFLEAPPAGIEQPAQIRKISLRQLEAALEDAVERRGGDVPQAVRFLAGIQRIEYVLVYPEHQDIVLAGPGEGWKLDEQGNVVGETTGRPVVHLDDLLVALRTVRDAHDGELSCSIEPRPEGVQAMQRILRSQRRFNPAMLDAIEQAMGPQSIVLSGIPESSRFARVMLAADYRMKRIAMQLESSPLRELPSFLQMAQQADARFTNMMPRWWLACDYQPLARSEDGLAWQLRGQGVKVLTEQNKIEEDGRSVPVAGRTMPLAQKWADLMTQHYDRLSGYEPTFAHLRNLMDLCVVAALIEKEGLLQKAHLGELPYVSRLMPLETYHPPRSVSTQCSFVRQQRGYLITASGGVTIDSWKAAGQSDVEPSLAPLRSQQAPAGDQNSWWWN